MNFTNMFDGMFQPIKSGCCKLGINGEVAVKTSSGYKTYNAETGRLTNCTNFAFDMDNMFWVVPTMKVKKGDIILVSGRPRCVIDVGNNSIKTFSYEDSTIDEVVPEHHVYMGKTYCYGKVFSPFSAMGKNNNSMSNMMKMMIFSQMFSGNSNTMSTSSMNPMMMMFMMKDNSFDDMFDGAFDFGSDSEEEEAK